MPKILSLLTFLFISGNVFGQQLDLFPDPPQKRYENFLDAAAEHVHNGSADLLDYDVNQFDAEAFLAAEIEGSEYLVGRISENLAWGDLRLWVDRDFEVKEALKALVDRKLIKKVIQVYPDSEICDQSESCLYETFFIFTFDGTLLTIRFDYTT